MGILKNCARGYRSHAPASCTAKLNLSDRPILGFATVRTMKPVRPAKPKKVSPTVFLCREHCFELHLVAWIFFYHHGILYLGVWCVKQIPILQIIERLLRRKLGNQLPRWTLGLNENDLRLPLRDLLKRCGDQAGLSCFDLWREDGSPVRQLGLDPQENDLHGGSIH